MESNICIQYKYIVEMLDTQQLRLILMQCVRCICMRRGAWEPPCSIVCMSASRTHTHKSVHVVQKLIVYRICTFTLYNRTQESLNIDIDLLKYVIHERSHWTIWETHIFFLFLFIKLLLRSAQNCQHEEKIPNWTTTKKCAWISSR